MADIRIELIVFYHEGFKAGNNYTGPEVTDENCYYYPGLKNFTEKLVAPPPDNLLSNIKQRNDEIRNIEYLGLLNSQGSGCQHTFKVILCKIPIDSPLMPQQDIIEGCEVWAAHDELYYAYIVLLNRIFWVPPTGPRIIGRFDLLPIIELSISEKNYRIEFGPPFGAGGGGGMK